MGIGNCSMENSVDDEGDTYTEYIWYTFKREIE